MSAIFTSFSHTHHGTNAINLELIKQSKRNEFSVASVCGQNKAWRHYKFSTEKMEQYLQTKQTKRKWGSVWAGDFSLSLSLSLSLVARTFWHAFALNLKGFFTHFIVVFSHLFAYKRHFLGYFAFLKFLNALFLGFCVLFVILSGVR